MQKIAIVTEPNTSLALEPELAEAVRQVIGAAKSANTRRSIASPLTSPTSKSARLGSGTGRTPAPPSPMPTKAERLRHFRAHCV
jgi:hypothetical protein